MLEELLHCDTLGGKEELLFLLFRALPLSNIQRVPDLKKYCTSNHFSIGRSFDGMLKLLEFMAFIKIADDVITVNSELFDPAKIRDQQTYFEQEDFVGILLLSLKRADCLISFIKPEALKRDSSSGLFYVKENLIPMQFLAFRNLLISIGFFSRDKTLDLNNLLINPGFTKLFETVLINSIKDERGHKKRKKTLSELKAQLENQEALGREAEIFVVDFEHRRLQGHPSINNVRRISEEYVNAGFDIESFSDKESVFIDRFIEVKSFSEEHIFHWSGNEIEIAKELGERYYLYLVDRNMMKQPGYMPRIFQNPYQQIFENEFWKKEPEVWIVSGE